ncbi:MAG: hypothetical protein HY447_04300 [Candidatus Omnitrophica bacterium]|nr:hypothetical protein [Candidatus Omnitrophota bacterium]
MRKKLTWTVLLTVFFFKVLGIEFTQAWAEITQDREKELAMETQVLLEEKKAGVEEAASEDQEALREELQEIQKSLLRFPKKDRFRFGGDFTYTYDTNASRRPVQQEEGDSLFTLQPFGQIDVGGRKTKLNFEFRQGRDYNAKRPENDIFFLEMRDRFARKFAKKISVSLNDRLRRQSQRVTEIDTKRVQWDYSNQATVTYQLSRKMVVNLGSSYTRQEFPHENFDQNGTYTYQLDPSVAFDVTPKTRVTLGYRWGITRDKTQGADNTTHEARLNYSGRITGKSSLTADVSLSAQDPHSGGASEVNSITENVGYIWQITPKTSIRTLYAHSNQLTETETVTDTIPVKNRTFTRTDTLSFSVRFRAHRKITTEFSFDGQHTRTKTKNGATPKDLTRQIVYPFQVALDLDLTKWAKMRLTYTFRYQRADEEPSENRAHTWFVSTNILV